MQNFDPLLLQFLHQHTILFKYYEHIPVFTVEESASIKDSIPWLHTKNLFLTDKKWWYYLVTIAAHKRFPVNIFRKLLWTKELSFWTAEQLYEQLHLTPGSVSLFWIIHNPWSIKVYIDEDIRNATHVWRHPNRNDATLVLDHNNLEKFLDAKEQAFQVLRFDENSVTISDIQKQ